MEWTKYPFVRFLLFFSAGIVSCYYINTALNTLITVFAITLAVFLGLHYFTSIRWRSSVKPFKGLLILIIVFLAGGINYKIKHPTFSTNHFTKTDFTNYRAVLASRIKPGERYSQAKLEVKFIKTKEGWERAEGQVLAFLKNDIKLEYGADLIIKGKPEKPEPPKNPLQFDYSQYLFSKGITHIHFLSPEHVRLYELSPPSKVVELAIESAKWIKKTLAVQLNSRPAEALLCGLLLGDKTLMKTETKEAFASSGLVHILAVSGFHTTLIFNIISILLGPLKKRARGLLLFTVIAVGLLWFYALVTGLSVSVIRATIMLTLLLVGKLLKREVHGVHILCLAAFIILLFDPLSLLDVGLQFSFLAVLGILLFTENISGLFSLKNRLTKQSWELISVTLSAQVFTFPLAIFYFHTFPLYFILSNLLAIVPTITLIYSGLTLLLVHKIPLINNALVFIIELTGTVLEYIVNFISSLPSFTQYIYLNHFQFILMTGGLLLLLTALAKRSVILVRLSYLAFLSLLVYVFTERYIASEQNLLAVFHIRGKTYIATVKGLKASIFSNYKSSLDDKDFKYNVEDFLRSKGICSFEFKKVAAPTLLIYNSKKIFITNGAKKVSLKDEVDYVIYNNLKPNFKGQLFKDQTQIIDGSNSENLEYKAYYTRQKGAFIEEF